MERIKSKGIKYRSKIFSIKNIVGILVAIPFTFLATSCLPSSCSVQDDDPYYPDGLGGTWVYEEKLENKDGHFDYMKMTLYFQKDSIGKVVEDWWLGYYGNEKNTMYFRWSARIDSAGNNIVRISDAWGEKNTKLFPYDDSAGIWTYKYEITDKILIIYDDDGKEWVCNNID